MWNFDIRIPRIVWAASLSCFALAGCGGAVGTVSSTSGTNVTTTASSAPTISHALAFKTASYSISQGAGFVTLTVVPAGGGAAASVTYSTSDGTAIAGKDYSTVSGTLQWAAGDTTAQTIAVPISNASPFVGTKTFSVTLSNPGGGATISNPGTANVIIAGDGSTPPAIAFTAAGFPVAQSAGSVTLTVTPSGGTGAGGTSAASVNYATANGTAVAGTDYTAVSGSLQWAANDTTPKTITVPVSNASPFTGVRTFTVVLSTPGNGATIGSPGTASVSITGDGSATTGSNFYIYQNDSGSGNNGMNTLWDFDLSFGASGAPIVYNDKTHPESGHTYDMLVPGGTAWQPASNYNSGHPSGSGVGPFGYDMSADTWMTFDIWTAYPAQNYDVHFEYLGNSNGGTADQQASSYIDNLLTVPGLGFSAFNAGGWTTVKIPLAFLGHLGMHAAYKFYIRDNSNNVGGNGTSEPFYLDNVGFVAGKLSWIYDGGATTGWNASTKTWNWDPSTPLNGWSDATPVGTAANYAVNPATITNLPSASANSLNGLVTPGYGPTIVSTNVIELSITSLGGMWKVKNAGGFNLSSYKYLTFGLLPTNANYSYQVQFYDTSGAAIGTPVSIGKGSSYTNHDWGSTKGLWTVYCVPLADFGSLPTTVGSLSIKDTSGLSNNVIYISAPGFFQ